jgi:hypothetical protein
MFIVAAGAYIVDVLALAGIRARAVQCRICGCATVLSRPVSGLGQPGPLHFPDAMWRGCSMTDLPGSQRAILCTVNTWPELSGPSQVSQVAILARPASVTRR